MPLAFQLGNFPFLGMLIGRRMQSGVLGYRLYRGRSHTNRRHQRTKIFEDFKNKSFFFWSHFLEFFVILGYSRGFLERKRLVESPRR